MRPPVTPPLPPSRNRRSPTFWHAATFSASPRPAPARPPPSSCRCSRMLEKGRARARMPRTLILEPTRELAAQVKEKFDRYGAGQKLNVALLIGGVSFGDQDQQADPRRRRADRNARPAARPYRARRTAAHRRRTAGDRRSRPHARHGLHPRHRAHLQAASRSPARRCSSPRRCRRKSARITETFLHNPQKVEVSQAGDHGRHRVAVPGRWSAASRMRSAKCCAACCARPRICRTRSSSAIASARSRSFYKSLQKHGFSVGALHGDMDQSARTAALDQFRKGELPLLVASDVAARGLDIPGSATSSISTCPIIPTTTSTASAAPAAPAAPAPRSRSSRRSTTSRSSRSRS